MIISNINISEFDKTVIIAEIGVNHEGSLSKCLKMIAKADNSGANLVKLQIADPESNYAEDTKSFKIFQKSRFKQNCYSE